MKALQKEWYKKLKEDGFEDIEETRSQKDYLKTWHDHYFRCRYTPDTFSLKEEYYRRASQFFHSYSFPTFLEREVWQLHMDGFSFRKISGEMKFYGIEINKDAVNRMIQRLIDVMKSQSDHG